MHPLPTLFSSRAHIRLADSTSFDVPVIRSYRDFEPGRNE
jgi:hypothetical protein